MKARDLTVFSMEEAIKHTKEGIFFTQRRWLPMEHTEFKRD
jgi:hypothetical protein